MVVYLSKGLRGIERAAKGEKREREREREWQSRVAVDLGGGQTPIVHATNHSLNPTSVTIASAGL